jgi:hypothetical protein
LNTKSYFSGKRKRAGGDILTLQILSIAFQIDISKAGTLKGNSSEIWKTGITVHIVS